MNSNDLEKLEHLGKELKNYNSGVYNHSLLVNDISTYVGKNMKLSLKELGILTIGAIFHDIGKIKVPNNILEKKGTLNDLERVLIRNHVTTGVSIVSEICDETDVLSIIGLHHLNEDGSGYKALIVDKNLRYNDLVKIVHVSNILVNTFDKNGNAKTVKTKLKESVENNNIANINIQKVVLNNLTELYEIMKGYKESTDSISKILESIF